MPDPILDIITGLVEVIVFCLAGLVLAVSLMHQI